MARCATSRWPVELTGRNSVIPSTTPRIAACHHSMRDRLPGPWQRRSAASMIRHVKRDDGKDTALARLLLARGVVDLATLRACLDRVRRERAAGDGGLVDALLAAGVAREALEQADTFIDGAAAPRPSAAP